MATTQQRYNQDFDRQLRVATTFQSGDWIFIDRPPLVETSDTDATRTFLSAFDELMPQSLGPFCIKKVRPHSLVINEHEINNVVLTGCATQAPHIERSKPSYICQKRHQHEEERKNNPRSAQRELKTSRAEKTKHISVAPEYTVDKIVRHIGIGVNI